MQRYNFFWYATFFNYFFKIWTELYVLPLYSICCLIVLLTRVWLLLPLHCRAVLFSSHATVLTPLSPHCLKRADGFTHAGIPQRFMRAINFLHWAKPNSQIPTKHYNIQKINIFIEKSIENKTVLRLSGFAQQGFHCLCYRTQRKPCCWLLGFCSLLTVTVFFPTLKIYNFLKKMPI